MDITREQYEEAYRLAHEIVAEKTSLTEAMSALERSGLNRNSGRDLIDAVRHMLDGNVYKRAISIATTDDFLTWIRRDHHDGAHRTAIAAVEAHIEYFTKNRGGGMPGYREVVERHRAQLDDSANLDLGITKFFDQVLNAPLNNSQWAWGARNLDSNRLFLRVWEDEVINLDDHEQVMVLKKGTTTKSPGFNQRLGHLDLMRQGVEAFGVVCVSRTPNSTGDREINTFHRSLLLKLGGLRETDTAIHAEVIGRIPTESLAGISETTTDIAEILRDRSLDKTTQEALVNARIGQGRFRSEVLDLWKRKCAVTGIETLAAIRASHIKPWRSSDNRERLDPSNGLPLVATLDALFDVGLITFDPDGKLIASPRLPDKDRSTLLVGSESLRSAPSAATKLYLEHHRRDIYRP